MSGSLFAPDEGPWVERLSAGTALLHGWACAGDALLLEAVDEVLRQSPPRGMVTPGGDGVYELVDALLPLLSDTLESVPELMFQADTSLATSNLNCMLGD